jgi:hypothetical protein
MTAPATGVTSASSATAAGSPIPAGHHGFSFHDILSALDPLQYLPVVGTNDRAVTNDVIPEPLWRLGSLLVSGLLAGPIGVAISLAATAAEKITGVDPEKVVAAQFNARATPGIVTRPETVSPVSTIVPRDDPGAAGGVRRPRGHVGHSQAWGYRGCRCA